MSGTVTDSDMPNDKSAHAKGRGPIIISRHGKPALNRDAGPRLTWKEYIDWWAAYEAGALQDGQSPPEQLKANVADAKLVLTSERLRAQQTAAMAAPHLSAIEDALYNEAPLPPPQWKVRFKPRTWNKYARAAWMLGHSMDGESVSEARIRARHAAEALHAHAQVGKVYLAAHGWFNRMIRKELLAIGWECTHNGGDSYWSYREYAWLS